MCMSFFCLQVFLCIMCMSAVPARPEEDIRSPGTGVTAGVNCRGGVGNWTWALWKSSNCLAVYPAPKWSCSLLFFFQHWNLFLTSKWWLLFPHSTQESQWLVTDMTNVAGFKSFQLFVVPVWTGLFIFIWGVWVLGCLCATWVPGT